MLQILGFCWCKHVLWVLVGLQDCRLVPYSSKHCSDANTGLYLWSIHSTCWITGSRSGWHVRHPRREGLCRGGGLHEGPSLGSSSNSKSFSCFMSVGRLGIVGFWEVQCRRRTGVLRNVLLAVSMPSLQYGSRALGCCSLPAGI